MGFANQVPAYTQQQDLDHEQDRICSNCSCSCDGERGGCSGAIGRRLGRIGRRRCFSRRFAVQLLVVYGALVVHGALIVNIVAV
jgi:hypothetical protein